jgi:CRISPR-associated endonuclease/helicase Cas3
MQSRGNHGRSGSRRGLPARRGPGAPGEYASAVAETGLVLRREGVDLHDPGIFREYFSRMYRVVDTDEAGIESLRSSLDYPEVADQFRLIPDDTVPVVVPYEESDPRKETSRRRLLERIRREGFLRPGDQRPLQPYVVGLRSQELERFTWMTEEIAEGVRLWTGEYDTLRGISAMTLDPADPIR